MTPSFQLKRKRHQTWDGSELQAHVDRFDVIYNTERGHQGLPGRITPQQAWDATPIAEPPRPKPSEEPVLSPKNATGNATRRPSPHGMIGVLGTQFMIGRAYAGTTVHAIWDLRTVTVFDEHGTHIITFTRPAPGTTYVGSGKPRGFMANHEPSPMS